MSFNLKAGQQLLHIDIPERLEEGLPERRASYLEELHHIEGANIRKFRLRLADQDSMRLGFADGGGTPLAELTVDIDNKNVFSVKSFKETQDGMCLSGNGNAFQDSGYLPELAEALHQMRDEGIATRFDALVEPYMQNGASDNLFSMLTRDGQWEKFSMDRDPADYLAGTVDIHEDMFIPGRDRDGLSDYGLTRDKIEALAGNAGINLSIPALTDTRHGTEPTSDKLDLFPQRVDAHIRVRAHGTHDLTHFTRLASLDVTNADRVMLQKGAVAEDDLTVESERTKIEMFRVERSLVSEAGTDASL